MIPMSFEIDAISTILATTEPWKSGPISVWGARPISVMTVFHCSLSAASVNASTHFQELASEMPFGT